MCVALVVRVHDIRDRIGCAKPPYCNTYPVRGSLVPRMQNRLDAARLEALHDARQRGPLAVEGYGSFARSLAAALHRSGCGGRSTHKEDRRTNILLVSPQNPVLGRVFEFVEIIVLGGPCAGDARAQLQDVSVRARGGRAVRRGRCASRGGANTRNGAGVLAREQRPAGALVVRRSHRHALHALAVPPRVSAVRELAARPPQRR